MTTFQITLQGYDAATSLTDDLIKWVNSPSLPVLHGFIQGIGWSAVEIQPMDRLMTKLDGVDHEICVPQ